MAESTRSSRWLGRRVLFTVGRFRIWTYAVLLYLGFAVGVVWGAYESGLDFVRFAVAASVLLAFALNGAKIWYLVGHPEFFKDRPLRVRWSFAGTGIYGGLVLSFAVSWPVARLAGLEFWRFWDGMAVVILVGFAVGRIGCLINGCCVGRETQGPFGMWLPDFDHQWKRRYPTQLFEAGWSALILAIGVSLHGPSDPPGLLFLGSAAAYGIGRLGMEQLRANAESRALSTRMNTVFSAVLAVSAVAAFALKLR